jgi:hypothetical protein
VHRDEREPPRVRRCDVERAGHELERRSTDQDQHETLLDGVTDRAEDRALEQLRVDRPELGQEQRDARQPAEHVDALAHAIEVHRARRPQQPGRRVLEVVRHQPGEEAERERDAERDPEPRRDTRVVQATRESPGLRDERADCVEPTHHAASASAPGLS